MLKRLIAPAIVMAIVGALTGSDAARAETPWLGATADMVSKDGRWFIGTGVAGGGRHLPDWKSTTASRVPFSPAPPPNTGPARFSTDLTFVAPGGTLGYVFPDGSLPAWMGRRVRLSVAGGYFNAHGSDNSSTFLPNSVTYYTTVDGRYGNQLFSATPAILKERLRVK
jgi:hypothetical protein